MSNQTSIQRKSEWSCQMESVTIQMEEARTEQAAQAGNGENARAKAGEEER